MAATTNVNIPTGITPDLTSTICHKDSWKIRTTIFSFCTPELFQLGTVSKTLHDRILKPIQSESRKFNELLTEVLNFPADAVGSQNSIYKVVLDRIKSLGPTATPKQVCGERSIGTRIKLISFENENPRLRDNCAKIFDLILMSSNIQRYEKHILPWE